MPFESLAKSLGSKPLVLAGPMLRKVTPQRVSVWLALRKPCSVTLKVLDEDGKPALEGNQETVAIGSHLHLVVVTAKRLEHRSHRRPDRTAAARPRTEQTRELLRSRAGAAQAETAGSGQSHQAEDTSSIGSAG
jgi:hypothetical protein